MGFVYNDFGTLEKVEKNVGLIIITNIKGEQRKMSIIKYQESANEVYKKAQNFIGKEVNIQTSQNTNDWSDLVWFSNIYLK